MGKKIIILILGIVTAITAVCQQPAVVDPILVPHWPDVTLVKPELRKVYKVLLRKDHAIYAENLPDSVWVTICYGCYVPGPIEPPVVAIDSTIIDGVTTNTANKYIGTWFHRVDANWTQVFEDKSASFSNTANSSIEIDFTGYRVQWLSEISNNKGSAVIKIDDGPEITINLLGSNATPPNIKSMVFDSSNTTEYKNLANGPHKLIIKVVGNGSVLHDAIKVYSK